MGHKGRPGPTRFRVALRKRKGYQPPTDLP